MFKNTFCYKRPPVTTSAFLKVFRREKKWKLKIVTIKLLKEVPFTDMINQRRIQNQV